MPPKRASPSDADRGCKKPPKKTVKLLSKTVNYSLCIPTTLIANCRNLEQATHAVYQVAQAATAFNVAEIVVLDLGGPSEGRPAPRAGRQALSDAMLIASLLQYFVTPPYLASAVFKKSYARYFQHAAKLPRLAALPFMRHLDQDGGRYREGLAIRMAKPGQPAAAGASGKKPKPFNQTAYINVGRAEPLHLKNQLVPVNVRVTVDTHEHRVVSPEEAYGDYVGARASYGYHVRIAKSFGAVFTECSLPGGYSQALWANCGDFYYNEQRGKSRKAAAALPYVARVVTGDSAGAPAAASVLLVCGKWDHISASFQRSRDQFEGCDGAHQFFDGQLPLPGAAPAGLLAIHDGCMVALAVAASLAGSGPAGSGPADAQ